MQEPLVLLTDMMCDARLFGPQIAELSSEIPVTVAPTTQGERVEEIASGLLGLLPARFALAGLGFGGFVAMEILRRAPSRISRIALMDTTPLAETPQSSAELESLIVGARAGRLEEVLGQSLGSENLAPGPQRVEIQALVRDMGLYLGSQVFVRQARARQRRSDQQGTLRKCKVPTLVLCGEHDRLIPVKRHSFMADLIPNAELRVIEGAGHLPTLEQPSATTAALREWLSHPLILQQ